MNDIFPADDQPAFFQVEGQLSEEDVLFLTEESGAGSTRSVIGDLTLPFRAKSYFSIGTPIVLSLTELLIERGESIPADIRLQTQRYEFYQVHLACSFQAAPGCRFHNARFALSFETATGDPHTATPIVQKDAIAYDLFPLRFEDERKISLKRSFSPAITFNYNPISSSLTLPIYERTEEYVTYTIPIEAFDLQGTQPAWSFARTELHEISGPQRLFMIVRKSKGIQVKARFSLQANVQFMIGGMALDVCPLIMLFRRSGSPSTITDAPAIPLC